METSDITLLDPIYALLKTAKKLLNEKDLNDTLNNFVAILQMSISIKVTEENRARLTDTIHEFQTRLAESKFFKESFGPVSFVKGKDKDNLDFVLSLLDVDNEEILNTIEEGKKLLEEDKVKEARKKFDEAIKKKPYSSEILLDVAESYIGKELYNDAEKVLYGAKELKPDDMHISNRLGIILRKQEKYEKAIDEFKRAREISPDDENICFNMGFAYFKWGKISDAERCLKKALEINPAFNEGEKLLDVVIKNSFG